jgi:hypothetical protein
MRSVAFSLLVAAAAVPFAFACGGPPAPQPPQTETSAAPLASNAPVATTEPTSSAAPDPRAQPWNPPDGADDDQVMQSCEPIVQVFKRAKIQSADEARALLADMEKDPPPIPSAQWSWCKERIAAIIDRKAKAEAAGTPEGREEAEAKNALGQIAKDMAVAFEREELAPGPLKPGARTNIVKKLCPSAKPIPAKLDAVTDKTYQSKSDEWNKDKGWFCLKFEINQPQAWQYEVKADAKSFTVFARRMEKGTLVEYSLPGKIEPKTNELQVAPQIAEKRTPAKK